MLRELISAICASEREDVEQLMVELREASLQEIGLHEIVGHQLMQKISFIESHLKDNQ